MADIDSFGYYDDIIDEEEAPKALDYSVTEEEEVEAPRTDADADAAETLASFPKSDSPPPKKKETIKKRKTTRDSDTTTEPKKKRTSKKKKKQDQEDDEVVVTPTKTRKKREKVDLPTLPDGSIDLSRATMRDIIRAHDKYGKPTKAQAERERVQEKRKKKKTGEDEEEEEEEEGTEEQSSKKESFVGSKPSVQEEEEEIIINRGEEEEEEEEVVEEEEQVKPAKNVFAPQVRVDANGNMILDEESMVVHQDVEETRYDPEFVFESTQYINSNSFSKRGRTERWSKEETAKFYRVIQQFGSDFTLISKLFPNRNRTQIRNKFKKEEKENPQKIDHALRNRIAPDFDEIRNAVKVAVEKEAQERKEKGIVDEPDIEETAPEVEIRPIVEGEEEQPAEEPSVIYEDEETVAEEPSVVVEEPVVEEEPEEEVPLQPKKPEVSSYDYFGNYDEEEEIVGTLD